MSDDDNVHEWPVPVYRDPETGRPMSKEAAEADMMRDVRAVLALHKLAQERGTDILEMPDDEVKTLLKTLKATNDG